MRNEEEKMQAECFQWHWNTYPGERQMLFHTYNNSWSRTEGAMKKAIGVVAGVSDFILIHMACMLFIELKTESGVQKPEQETFERKVIARRHRYIIVRSVNEFKQLIISLYGK